jgi:hypothetical protein
LNGALNTLLKELAEKDPSEYRRHMRMSPEKFKELLAAWLPLFARRILQ